MTEPNDDPDVADDETLLRRIPDLGRADFFPVDQATGRRRLSSGAFAPDYDGVSVYRETVLARAGLGYHALVRDPLNAVAALTAGEVRSREFGVAADPQPPTSYDPDPHVGTAHALIVGFASLSRNQQRRKQRELADAARIVLEPPEPGEQGQPSGTW